MARTVGSMSHADVKGEVTHSMITPSTYQTETSTPSSTSTKRVRMSRYSWDAPEKTHNLITLLITTLENKEDGERRYVSGQDWELILIAFNEAMVDAPVSNVFALKNRLALLKLQFKDYQKVMEAKRNSPNGELDAKEWQALIAKYPETAKWRFSTLEYYDKLLAYFKLAGMEDGEIPNAPVGRPRLDKFKTAPKEKKKVEKMFSSATIVTPNCSPSVSIRPTTTDDKDGEKPVSAPVDTLVAAVAELEQQSQNQGRKRQAEVNHHSTSMKHARMEKSAPVPSQDKKTLYEKALEVLTKLDLSIRERVDAKLFLTVDRFQLTFLHMDEEEQEEFLKRYCFQARDQYGRWKE